jgi:D-alanine-D-alanine ligase
MTGKTRLAVLFGGKSAEHEISLISAMNIIGAMDRDRYEPVLIGVDKRGKWFLQQEDDFLKKDPNPKTISLTHFNDPLAVIPGEDKKNIINLRTGELLEPLGAVFPILHGPLGEDGAVQGLLKHLHLPFVGPGVLASAVGMDKEMMKRVLNDEGIANAKYMVFRREDRDHIRFDEVEKKLGLPMFVKPANLGSSVGISKVKSREDFDRAIDLAFRYDLKLLIEEFVKGREIECAVLGNESPRCSVPGEVIPVAEFYSYEAKYLDDKGAILDLPAKNLDAPTLARIQSAALHTYKVLCCEGLTRVDFFLKESGEIFVNEINTLPGFTRISMYPKLWELSGIPYSQLVHELIQFAIARFQNEESLKTVQEF